MVQQIFKKIQGQKQMKRARVLEWEGGKIEKKNGKYMSKVQQVTEGVEDLKQKRRKEKVKARKRKIKLAKEVTINKTMYQIQ